MKQGGLLDKILTQSGNYLSVSTIYPEIQALLELNTNIKMVGAQLGVASKQSAGFNTQISRLSYTSGLASDSLMKVVSSAAKYNKAIGTDMLSSAVRFSDATGVDTQKLGEFTSKMLSLGSISTKTYDEMLVKILQTRESYGLSTEATYGLMEATENYYITLGKTGDEIVKASGKMAEFISRMNSAGIETEIATDILDKMINPDKMEDNIMLMNRLGISISDMVVGEPLKNLEDVAPRLKALAQEITSQPNRMLANEMAKMYGYTLAEMQKMTKIETDQKIIAEKKTLQEYRTQIQTAQTGLKDVMTQIVGGFTLSINNVAQELNKVVGPKVLGATLGAAVFIGLKRMQSRLEKASLSFKKNIKEGIEEGADSFYKKLSGIGAGEERGSFNKLRKISRVSPDEPEYTESSIVDSFGLKTKIRNPFVASDKIIDDYNEIVGEGAYQSQKRVDEYSKDYNKYKNSPKEASDFFKAREKIVKESLGAETSWLMKKSMSQQENKMAKAPKIRKDDSLDDAKAKVKGQLGGTYEGLLKRSTQLQEVENEITKLKDIGDGARTDAQDRLLIKLQASGKTLSGSVEETIAKLKGTSIGSEFINEMIKDNERDIARYTEQTDSIGDKITEAEELLANEGYKMDANQRLIMESNIKSMEEKLKEVGELVTKTSKMNENLKTKGGQAKGTANLTGEETLNSNAKETIAKLKGTAIGSGFMDEMIVENEKNLANYRQKSESITIELNEAKELLADENLKIDDNQRLIMESNIKSMEEDLKKVKELVSKTSTMNENLKIKSEQARGTASLTGEETLSGSIEEIITKLKGTVNGDEFIDKMIAENENDIAKYKKQSESMTIELNEAKELLADENLKIDDNQRLIMESNIKSMEESLKKVEELVLKTSTMNKNLREKSEQAGEAANIIGEETTINIKKQGEIIKEINEDLIKQNKVAAMNIAYGLETTAGVGARNLTRGKTLAKSALSGMTGIAKSVGIPLGVGSAVAMGVGLLVKSVKKSEEFQKVSSELAEASAPILDFISTTLGKAIAVPMKFVASAVSKISKAPMFDKKDDVDLEILDDMRNSYKVEQQEVVAWLKYIGETSKESAGYNQKTSKSIDEQNANQWVLANATRT